MNYDRKTETSNSLQGTLGSAETRIGIYSTVEAANSAGTVSPILDANELEEPLINEKGEINYDELNRQRDTIEGGAVRINALSLGEEQGRITGGRRNVEASLLLRGDVGADGSKQSYSRERQEEILREYAKKEEIWISPETINEWNLIADDVTMESRVYRNESGDSVIKVGYNYLNFYDTPLDFLTNKISLNNYLFPDTGLELIGFTETYGATNFICLS
ncbi:hypothetical protein AGMMS50239_27180 [Bacteroidia bacterium]|nr:hypothetical protein AGMMS50239_27180 [Bacteroidia bacterium]